MTPYLFYGAGVLLLLSGAGLHGLEYIGDYMAAKAAERKEQRLDESVNALFQHAANRELYDDDQPRRLPPTTETAALPLEATPELADPLDELAPRPRTGW